MTDAAITTLNRKRGNVKSQITKISKAVNERTLDHAELTSHLDILSRLQVKFDEIKEEYYNLVSEEDFEQTEEILSTLDDEIQKLEVSLKTSINKILHENSKSTNDSSNKQDAFAVNNNDQTKSALFKLPKIPLPIFTGKLEEWNIFKTQFQSLIHENAELSESEKLFYLKGSLKGDAKIIETSDDTYESLFKALEQRYENRRLIVDCHMKNILCLQSIKHESAKDIRNLLDNLKKNLRSLKVLEFDRDKFSNAMLLNIILEKLDRETRKQYEITLKDNEVPNFDDFLEFLERRCQILNSISTNISSKFNQERTKSFFIKSNKAPKICFLCNTQHALYHCDKFKSMSLADRINIVKRNKLCYNCLGSFHNLNQCKSKSSCLVCRSSSHHTTLHKYSTPAVGFYDSSQNADLSSGDQNNDSLSVNNQTPQNQNNSRLSLFSSGINKTVLINTAIVYIKDSTGIRRPLRAILDTASHSNFLSSHCANILGLEKERINISICGLNDSSLNVKTKVTARLSNKNDEANWNVDLLIVPKITGLTPSCKINISDLNIPANIKLADPNFYMPQKVDVLLGAEFIFEFLQADKIKLCNNLYLQASYFGYLVSGSISNAKENNSYNYCFLSKSLDTLDKTLRSFWEVENFEIPNPYKSEELNYCNDHFEKTHFRKPNGRYVVEMPFKPEFSEEMLGNSKEIASKRLNFLWKRLERDETMKYRYTEFLNEYESLNHLMEIKENNDFEEGYYLPHHGILRPSSKTTKLRVVFDASAKTTSGKSLNDFLCKGGVLQDDLFSILVRFRKHVYAFTADIKQMFRMIEINPSQYKFLKILWKDNKSSLTKVLQLLTVTYGTACAPYLATKTLQQLAIDERVDFPLASEILLNDFYMDDCLSGSSDLHEFERIQAELSQLLLRGGMSLHKCCTNKSDTTNAHIFQLDRNAEEITVKTLGMLWNSSSDTFTYKVNISTNCNFTKRDVLSQIARIYDPLGLLGPVIAKAKIFMQQLWLLKLDWNEQLPPDISQQWGNFIQTLPELESLKIPRCILNVNVKSVVLYGFADASSKAYGAVIYIKTVSQTNEITSRLLCSKSRVAPTKVMTIPRLELSACLLLIKLTHKVLAAIKQPISAVRLYSDSSIALAWINTPTNLLKTFVCNRVAEIQQLSKDFQWAHIPSDRNPADMISRGLDVKAIAASELWWHGPDPSELCVTVSESGSSVNDSHDKLYLDELNATKLTLTLNCDSSFFDNLLDLTNNFCKLIRILAFIFRFVFNCRNSSKQIGSLIVEEYRIAENILIKNVQVMYFKDEINALKRGSSVATASKLRFLNPFLDEFGLLRVGGRLSNADIEFDQKFPIILPAGHKLTKLIFQYYHVRDFHVGPQALLNTIRLKYWPLGGRNLARKTVHECVQCFKNNPKISTQLMGDLPPERVMSGCAFVNVGIDLCGPFLIKYKGQRKGTLQKIYVAIFICMVTKAIHLEFISDLTTEAMLAALKRFFARRGKSSVIFSDNATNFVGASAELKRLSNLFDNTEISSYLVSEGINWKFSPPRAPNFGGLWEAGVKAFKYHLKRVVGAAHLTLEEFLSVIIQIEGILNSRPLSPLSTDIDNFQVLTPGHFLIGKPINSIPEPNFIDQKDNLLSKWQKTQKMVQIIWKKWQNCYLSHLQQRNKWFFKQPNLLPGMLVLIKDSQLPLCTWSIGRITNVIPGADGSVRVVDIRTPKGHFRRPVSKISILPIEDNHIISANN